MKIYLISENKDMEIAMANAISKANHSPIMSELSYGDYNDMIDEAIDNVKSGYDLMLMFASDSINACIEANKTGKLRAVVCSTQEDAARAKKAGVNLVIIDGDANKTEAYGVIRGLLSATAQQPTKKEPEKQQPAAKPLFKMPQMQRGQRVEEEEGEEPEEEEDDAPPPKKEDGIVGKIKYHFGLD
ncbi:MAG TPA: hypothetical protein VMV00_03055 [Candidatus Baltobacteraceae bacterium]|nr:hypothetical protein [Candidatus Baltobacteraceae bacterium]